MSIKALPIGISTPHNINIKKNWQLNIKYLSSDNKKSRIICFLVVNINTDDIFWAIFQCIKCINLENTFTFSSTKIPISNITTIDKYRIICILWGSPISISPIQKPNPTNPQTVTTIVCIRLPKKPIVTASVRLPYGKYNARVGNSPSEFGVINAPVYPHNTETTDSNTDILYGRPPFETLNKYTDWQ